MIAKRIAAVLGTAVTATVLAAPSATAGPGEWDFLGQYALYESSQPGVYRTLTAKSGGGDLRVCLLDGPSWTARYSLWEYDPNNADDHVMDFYLDEGRCVVFRSIGGYVDGDNNRAEFYIRATVRGLVEIHD